MVNTYLGQLKENMGQFKNFFGKSETPFTAERAWVETTYGQGSYKPIEERIKNKQKYIQDMIKNKFEYGTNNTNYCKSYRCVIDIEEDLKNHTQEILQPFYEGGFDIINLSEKVDEIGDENVFLISWRHIFDKEVRLPEPPEEVMICD